MRGLLLLLLVLRSAGSVVYCCRCRLRGCCRRGRGRGRRDAAAVGELGLGRHSLVKKERRGKKFQEEVQEEVVEVDDDGGKKKEKKVAVEEPVVEKRERGG